MNPEVLPELMNGDKASFVNSVSSSFETEFAAGYW
jgi:hypothetical protein